MDAIVSASGVEVSLRIGQRVRHSDYQGRRVTGIVNGMSVESERGLVVSVVLDEPIIIPPTYEGDREIRINWQTAQAHEFIPFDDRDELISEMLAALQSVMKGRGTVLAIPVMDQVMDAIAKVTGSAA
jgi:hypothetical protein